MTGLSINPLALWAKTDRGGGSRYHPLICHLLDVAVVAESLWDKVLGESCHEWVAGQLGVDQSAARAWTAYLAGLHDIGKACPTFQQQFKEGWDHLQAGGLPASGLQNRDVPHGSVSAIVLRDLLRQRGVSHQTASSLSTAVGGHHGTFPRGMDLNGLKGNIGRGPWKHLREAFDQQLSNLISLPEGVILAETEHPLAMWLAGFVSVADWIGSNIEFFPLRADAKAVPHDLNLENYLAETRDQAQQALDRLGWLGWEADGDLYNWVDLFPTAPNPRPLQRATIDLAPTLKGPVLVIVEAPTGEGKTEAAFYLADQWSARERRQGAYVALPTQATSNQMFSRVKTFLKHRYPDAITNLQLLHGQASLSREFEQLLTRRRFAPDGVEGAGAEDDRSVVAAEWFTYRKRGLLAPFGVGTIDQVLLAVLQTRHVFVRLFGLAHKTLIVDEIHAYDTYMTSLLEQLLEWCAALGTSVVLLSATLPDSRRRQLTAAYTRGLGVDAPGELASAVYPRLSWVSPRGADATSFDADPALTKSVHIEWVDAAIPGPGESGELAAQLESALAGGGCLAVICNTVGRAQKMYQTLRETFGDDVDLLHARFPFEERDRREKRALRRFGKLGETVVLPDGQEVAIERPARAILVATQVIEQSLDIDFDLMVSDFAPVDLLIQRAGRLHRHQRESRPPALASRARLWLTRPQFDSDAPASKSGAACIYDEHVLLRSWLALRDRIEIALPGDVEELIEAVYDDSGAPAGMPDVMLDTWERTREELEKRRRVEAREAATRRLGASSSSDLLWRLIEHGREEESPELHPAHQALTRLIGPSVPVILLYGNEDAAFADAARSDPINYRETSDMSTVRRLLMRSVTLTDRRVVFTLLDAPPPSSWSRTALLRNHRLIFLDSASRSEVGNHTIKLSNELGVFITKL